MACRAAFRSLPLGRAVSAVSITASSSSSPSLRISRSPRRRPRAFKFQIRSAQTESKLEPEIQLVENEFSSKKWKIKMLYDGECPLCMREVNMLKERNKLYGAIKFVDISSKDYSPKDNQGLDYKTVMGRIHAILSDGTVVTDVDAFRRLYEEVGLGWVYAVTKYEPIATIAYAVYGVWAKYRLQITGRPPLEDILESRKGDMKGSFLEGRFQEVAINLEGSLQEDAVNSKERFQEVSTNLEGSFQKAKINLEGSFQEAETNLEGSFQEDAANSEGRFQ